MESREEVDADIIVGAIFDKALAAKFRYIVATGLRQSA
jgi:hypothetical protein